MSCQQCKPLMEKIVLLIIYQNLKLYVRPNVFSCLWVVVTLNKPEVLLKNLKNFYVENESCEENHKRSNLLAAFCWQSLPHVHPIAIYRPQLLHLQRVDKASLVILALRDGFQDGVTLRAGRGVYFSISILIDCLTKIALQTPTFDPWT